MVLQPLTFEDAKVLRAALARLDLPSNVKWVPPSRVRSPELNRLEALAGSIAEEGYRPSAAAAAADASHLRRAAEYLRAGGEPHLAHQLELLAERLLRAAHPEPARTLIWRAFVVDVSVPSGPNGPGPQRWRLRLGSCVLEGPPYVEGDERPDRWPDTVARLLDWLELHGSPSEA